jgi:hypothetical protein
MTARGDETEQETIPPIAQETEDWAPPPWELLENGRYMPRRIRGSFRGRELG